MKHLLVADLTGDGEPDIATAALFDDAVYLFENRGGGTFGSPTEIPA